MECAWDHLMSVLLNVLHSAWSFSIFHGDHHRKINFDFFYFAKLNVDLTFFIWKANWIDFLMSRVGLQKLIGNLLNKIIRDSMENETKNFLNSHKSTSKILSIILRTNSLLQNPFKLYQFAQQSKNLPRIFS